MNMRSALMTTTLVLATVGVAAACGGSSDDNTAVAPEETQAVTDGTVEPDLNEAPVMTVPPDTTEVLATTTISDGFTGEVNADALTKWAEVLAATEHAQAQGFTAETFRASSTMWCDLVASNGGWSAVADLWSLDDYTTEAEYAADQLAISEGENLGLCS